MKYRIAKLNASEFKAMNAAARWNNPEVASLELGEVISDKTNAEGKTADAFITASNRILGWARSRARKLNMSELASELEAMTPKTLRAIVKANNGMATAYVADTVFVIAEVPVMQAYTEGLDGMQTQALINAEEARIVRESTRTHVAQLQQAAQLEIAAESVA